MACGGGHWPLTHALVVSAELKPPKKAPEEEEEEDDDDDEPPLEPDRTSGGEGGGKTRASREGRALHDGSARSRPSFRALALRG